MKTILALLATWAILLLSWCNKEIVYHAPYDWPWYTDEISQSDCATDSTIDIWDTVYFAYVGNRTFDEPVDYVIVDWAKVWYSKQIVTYLVVEMYGDKRCVTSINWYGNDPQPTMEMMKERAKKEMKEYE
jgi:hypothetical protein